MENETGTAMPPAIAKLKMSKRAVLPIVLVLAILGILFYFKGLFVAAIVDGKPISRLAVIKELESVSGRQALDSLIVKQLIETEANKKKINLSKEDVDAEIKTLADQISKQGGSLQLVLAQQGVTPDQFREQMVLKKKLEKILEDKLQVSDEEINQYLEQNKLKPAAGISEDDLKNQVREQLKNQKFGEEADKFITEIRSRASIQYYVSYGEPEPAPAPKEFPADTQTPPADNPTPPASFPEPPKE